MLEPNKYVKETKTNMVVEKWTDDSQKSKLLTLFLDVHFLPIGKVVRNTVQIQIKVFIKRN